MTETHRSGDAAVLRRALCAGASLFLLAFAARGEAQEVGSEVVSDVREVVDTLTFPELRFDPPQVTFETLSNGVTVLFSEDRTLPLVDVYVRFKGGYGYFDRGYYAAATAVPALLRNGGTETLPPDSVDRLVDRYSLSFSFGTGGGSSSSRVNTLTEHVEPALDLWSEILKRPRFDSAQVEVWRGQSRESVRRRADNPGRLAFSEFNRLMFGDHPVGWEMELTDLEREKLSEERLRWVHRRVFCPENMILGVTGDLSWDRARTLLEEAVADWPECAEPLPEAPEPVVRGEPGVFVIPRELSQSTVVLAGPGGVQRAPTDDYYASRIANSILGAGGFSSRLMTRVRTEEGLAYSASSLWTAPEDTEGIVGAITQTRGESTVEAVRLVLQILGEMRQRPPEEDEVRTAVEEIVNGFVFNFESSGQVVSRQMFYMAQELPRDWLERYLEGIQSVEPADVHRVFSEHVDPSSMTILILGDTARFDEPIESLGFGAPRIIEVERPHRSSTPP